MEDFRWLQAIEVRSSKRSLSILAFAMALP